MNKSNQQEDFQKVKTTNMGHFDQIPSQIGSNSGKAAFILFKEFILEIFQKNDYAGQYLSKFENMSHMCLVKNPLENLVESHKNQAQYNEKLLNWIGQQQIAQFHIKANMFGNLWRQNILVELMKGNSHLNYPFI